MAGLFQVLYGTADGTFRPAEVLNGTDDKPLIIQVADSKAVTERICTRPFAVDWNNDGHLDLIVGNFTGTFYWFKGVGKVSLILRPNGLILAIQRCASRGRIVIRSSSIGMGTGTSM